jgi:hypothetical protein
MQDVGDEVDEHDEDREDERDALHHREVAMFTPSTATVEITAFRSACRMRTRRSGSPFERAVVM